MRLTLASRVLVPPALCAAIVFAATGPAAALTSTPDPYRAAATSAETPKSGAKAPIPGAAALAQKVEALRGKSGAPASVTALLDDVLAADGGRLSATQAAEHSTAVKRELSAMSRSGTSRAARADAVDDALVTLEKATDDVIAAAASGGSLAEVTALVDTATGLVDSTVSDILDAVLTGLPDPSAPQPDLPVTMPDTQVSLPPTLPTTVPDMASLFTADFMPDLSGVSDASDTPDVLEVPHTPEVADFTEIPEVADFTEIPEVSDFLPSFWAAH